MLKFDKKIYLICVSVFLRYFIFNLSPTIKIPKENKYKRWISMSFKSYF